ncbi:MAG: hypothetical protein EAZ41_07565 [Sphingobacteriia bacterium]|nr:MAG: hypothetical protein EAZ41_07565 [Sphingobacteriia bacterium]
MKKLASNQKINRYKVYTLAIFNLIAPRKFKNYFSFKNTPSESLAIGVTMTKIKYWRSFLISSKIKKRTLFPQPLYR